MNGDGLVNCIDYAQLFRVLYGDKARIIRNINPVSGMNHLLNAVPDGNTKLVNGQPYLIYVEPQGSYDTWRPDTFWGSDYMMQYNMDETDYWTEQIKEYNF
jgi:hypothetical protein